MISPCDDYERPKRERKSRQTALGLSVFPVRAKNKKAESKRR